MGYKNYYKIRKFSFTYDYLCIIDVKEHIGLKVFNEFGLQFKVLKQFSKSDSNYVFIFIRIKKKDAEKVYCVLDVMKKKFLLLGYDDYQQACESFYKDIIKEDRI